MNQPTPKPRTVADLVEVTGLTENTVRMCIRTGSLPGYKTGSKYVIPGEAFEDFCKGRWVPVHRPVFSEDIRPVAQPESTLEPSDLVRRRTAKAS